MTPSTYARLVALMTGFSTMAVEMVASRVLAPAFGSSLAVWTNLIGLFMGALALGSFLGGSLASRLGRPRTLGMLPGLSGLHALALLAVTEPVLERLVHQESLGDAGGSFAAILILYCPPMVLLGMVAPVAIAMATSRTDETGRTSGTIYALSTVGSLAGTLAPALLTLPLFGVRRSIVLFAGLMIGAGLLGWLVPAHRPAAEPAGSAVTP